MSGEKEKIVAGTSALAILLFALLSLNPSEDFSSHLVGTNCEGMNWIFENQTIKSADDVQKILEQYNCIEEQNAQESALTKYSVEGKEYHKISNNTKLTAIRTDTKTFEIKSANEKIATFSLKNPLDPFTNRLLDCTGGYTCDMTFSLKTETALKLNKNDLSGDSFRKIATVDKIFYLREINKTYFYNETNNATKKQIQKNYTITETIEETDFNTLTFYPDKEVDIHVRFVRESLVEDDIYPSVFGRDYDEFSIWGVGGTEYFIYEDDILYKIHVFTSDGYFNTTKNITNTSVLVVAGGGGGGYWSGGGGGAGGVIYHKNNYSIDIGNYSISIGNGGAGSSDSNLEGTNGQNSSFDGLLAIGGGGGGSRYSSDSGNNYAGLAGGSGGGGGFLGIGGVGTSGQGYDGGTGYWSNPYRSGGGGGSNQTGGAGSSDGYGGYGLALDINGSTVYYAGGGGAGGDMASCSDGGLGGGGQGGSKSQSATSATANTGGGGGGGGLSSSTPIGNGGNGGAGIVIIRELVNTSQFEWQNKDYNYRIPIAIESGVNSTLLNFTATVRLNTSNSTLWNTDTCTNVRFVDLNNVTLDYDLDTINKTFCGNSTNNATFYISIPSLSSTELIYAYLGNTEAGSGENETGAWKRAYHVYKTNETDGATLYDTKKTLNLSITNQTLGQQIEGINTFAIKNQNVSGKAETYSNSGLPSTTSSVILTIKPVTVAGQNDKSYFSLNPASSASYNKLTLVIYNQEIRANIGAGCVVDAHTGGKALASNTVNRIAYVFNGANTTIHLFVNGTKIAGRQQALSGTCNNYDGVAIGGTLGYASGGADGYISNVQIYGEILTDDWLKADYLQSTIIGSVQYFETTSLTPSILNSSNGTTFFTEYQLYGWANLSDSSNSTWNVSCEWYMNDTSHTNQTFTDAPSNSSGILTNICNITSGVAKNQNWTLQMNATNGTTNITYVNSTTINISNSIPQITSLTAPATALNTSLIETQATGTDADNDTLTAYYQFSNETDVLQEYSTNNTYQCTPAVCLNNTNISVNAYMNDSENISTNLTNWTIITFRTAVSELSPSVAYRNTTIEGLIGFIDQQNATELNWTLFVNGTEYVSDILTGDLESETQYSVFNLTGFTKDSELILQVNGTLENDEVLSNVNSSALTISNFAPVLSLLNISPTPTIFDDDTINVSVMAYDIDADTLTFYYSWFLNDTNQTSLAGNTVLTNNTIKSIYLNSSTAGGFNETDLWSVIGYVSDGASLSSTNSTDNITVVGSVNISLSDGITMIRFSPYHGLQTNVSPVNQTTSIGLFNISNLRSDTTYNYSLYLNATRTGISVFCAPYVNQTGSIVLNTSAQRILTLTPENNSYIWCWANYSNPSGLTWTPRFRFEADPA